MAKKLILINPWIHDFAAYDLWSKPLGLLYLAGFLRHCGFDIHLVDCLDVNHPGMKHHSTEKRPKRRLYGTGKFWRNEISKPFPLKDVPRPFSRYGISYELFEQELDRVRDPAAILVTSLMTYWYPGVIDAICLAKKKFPRVPVVLGGIYARLCHEHAVERSGADRVATARDPVSVLKVLNEYGICSPRPANDPEHLPFPAFDLMTRIDYICLMTSTGCSYRCHYCASHFLNGKPSYRDPEEVLDEILFWHRNFDIRDFAFYDDALLGESGTHAAVLLENLARLGLKLRFHTPNALHVREITPDIARLMHTTGFRTIRLGLETSDLSLHRELDGKVEPCDFQHAVQNLHKAGFGSHQIGAYILVGLPGQSVDSVRETIDFVAGMGAVPFLSEYSPIPHTALWSKALRHSRYDLASEPLFHNNTLLSCWDEARIKVFPLLKKRALEVRQRFGRTSPI
jgi:radical SAM superfamily enzyme YgiQ (UPF0313 family)